MSNRANRPSPSVSATLYDAGDRMRGNDGNMYQIIQSYKGTNRWSKLARDSQYELGGEVLHKVREPGQVIEMLEDTGLYQDFMSADTDEIRYNIFENAEEIIEKGVYAEGGEIYEWDYQDSVYWEISDFDKNQYSRFCDTYRIDPEDGGMMSEFVGSLNEKEAKEVLDIIKKDHYAKGGTTYDEGQDAIIEENTEDIESNKEEIDHYGLHTSDALGLAQENEKSIGRLYDDNPSLMYKKGGDVSKLKAEYIAKGGNVFYSRFSKEFFEKDGLGAKYVSNNKFDDKRYKKDMIERLKNAKRPISVINIWGRNIDMDVSKYIDGPIIEDEQFAIDNTKQAKKLYATKFAKGGKTTGPLNTLQVPIRDEYIALCVLREGYDGIGTPGHKKWGLDFGHPQNIRVVEQDEKKGWSYIQPTGDFTPEKIDFLRKEFKIRGIKGTNVRFINGREIPGMKTGKFTKSVGFAKGGEVNKKGNEMLIGGLAGFLLGMFFVK
jgi:hypothetical protein